MEMYNFFAIINCISYISDILLTNTLKKKHCCFWWLMKG